MKIIVCVDKNFGILFNNRRVSKDKKILEDIFNENEKIFINQYSYNLFKENDYENKIEVSDNYSEDVFFLENIDINKFDNIEELVIYNFNRRYPSDFKLDIDLTNYKLLSEKIIVGNSHKEIIKTVYERVR